MLKVNNVNYYSYIRLLHAVPDAPAVDVYANDNLIARKLPYQGFTHYKKVKSGEYNIKIYPAGDTENLVYETNIAIPDETINTIVVTGVLEDMDVKRIEEPQIAIPPDASCIRFAHLSKEAPAVDITLPDGSVIFDDVQYGEITDYQCVNPGNYTFQARAAGTDDIILTVPNARLKPGNIYSIYAVGLIDEEPPLQVLIPLDGNTYIDM